MSQGGSEVANRENGAETQEPTEGAPPACPSRNGVNFDFRQGDERRSHRCDLLGGHPLGKLAVDCFYRTHGGLNHLLAPFGQLEGDPPAVVGVGATFEITLVDKEVHELANGLLRNAKFGQKILPRPAGGVYPRQDEDTVPR
jgi:hypothetical protein